MKHSIYLSLAQKKKDEKKSFAILIDPDKITIPKLDVLINLSTKASVDYFFVGGSLIINNQLDKIVQHIKSNCTIPVVLFPGNPAQISKHADAILYLSLISGRNPELLIGQHVISAPQVKQSGLEIIPTGYMVVDGGAPTTVSYISNATPIPGDKDAIALCTAIAGELLGLKLIFMDAGSGAKRAVSENMITAVAKNISVPLIVGGGISDSEKAYLNCKAGADVIVVGNAIEKNASLITEMAAAVHQVSFAIN